ncbi:MAG: hypothetical protein GY711_35275 [bacterium]|nr:hypothetical protein [bacterium]
MISPLRLLLACLLALPSLAQQFQLTSGVLPTESVWSEGVELADVDRDGDLDLLIANGEGFATAGAPRQNGLWINQLVETGTLTFADESVARLGVHLTNGKGVTSGDVNGDGWPDLLYANAFNTDPPQLYINRGAAQPGFFDMESAVRGFTENLNSASAVFGDLDDDGDLDVILNDCGPLFLSPPGGVPRLFVNDGAGFFTEDAPGMPAPIKIGHMDAQLADVDGDWDLDYLGFNRGANSGGTHYLMLNDGNGQFTDASTTLPNTSNLVYEAEVGDLDGDDDPDLFYTSLTSFFEGYQENRIVPDGMLSFQSGSTLPPGVDDNEIVLFDYDVDGDFDVLVGSLGNRERLYRNDGGLVFVPDDARIQAVNDPTLDATVGDVDGDGDYDVVTVQGEGGGSWRNRLYLNTGPADTRAPQIVADDIDSVTEWPLVVHAKVRDQVLDDGVSYVTSRAAYAPFPDVVSVVEHIGGAFVPASINVSVGGLVAFANSDPGTQTVTSLTAPYAFDYVLASGTSVIRAFITPGTYSYQSAISGSMGTITVIGTEGSSAGFHSGGGIHRFEIPQQPGEFAVELFFTDAAGNVSVTDSSIVRGDGLIGTPYCDPAAVNSSGRSAAIYATGSALVAQNDVVLVAYDMPVNQVGIFLVGQAQGAFQPPGSQGTICLSGNIGRYQSPILHAGPDGRFELAIDLGALPVNPPVAVMSGETWNFQAWFRDVNPAPTSNFTHGVAIGFQ